MGRHSNPTDTRHAHLIIIVGWNAAAHAVEMQYRACTGRIILPTVHPGLRIYSHPFVCSIRTITIAVNTTTTTTTTTTTNPYQDQVRRASKVWHQVSRRLSFHGIAEHKFEKNACWSGHLWCKAQRPAVLCCATEFMVGNKVHGW
jgi:hypothetical protein